MFSVPRRTVVMLDRPIVLIFFTSEKKPRSLLHLSVVTTARFERRPSPKITDT